MNALYRFYNATDELLYVGITNNPPTRFSDHRRIKSWWNEVARIQIEQYDDRETLARAEAHAIQSEQPHYNVILAAKELSGPLADQFKELQRTCEETKKAYEEACKVRQQLIAQALAAGVKPADIARLTGLTRARITQLR